MDILRRDLCAIKTKVRMLSHINHIKTRRERVTMSSSPPTAPSMDDTSTAKSFSLGDDEKTIPFLRRLRDMLQENKGVVSFYPGHHNNGQTMLGRIVVHDRARVEAEVLPRYFNHASFASLRRQLNYFSFTRVGKGRQRGAIYCNEGVIELDDILHLKRRPAGTTSISVDPQDIVTYSDEPIVNGQDSDEAVTLVDSTFEPAFENSLFPFVHLPPTKKRKKEPLGLRHIAQRRRFFKQPSVVSPMSSSPSSEDEQCAHQQIILDLTVPCTLRDDHFDAGWKPYRAVSCSANPIDALPRDEDILSGSKALLSFSHGVSRLGFAHV